MKDTFSLSMTLEMVTMHYLRKQLDYLTNVFDLPTVDYSYPYREGILIASRGEIKDTGFDLYGLIYFPTKKIADKCGLSIKAARLLQKHIQFDLPISFAAYLKILKNYAPDRIKSFHELPEVALLTKL